MLPDFSMSGEQGEKTSSTTVLTTYFDDDVKKYSVIEIPQDESESKSMCGRPIGSGNTIYINSRCRIKDCEGVKRVTIPRGQLYIQRNKSAICYVPTIGSFSLAESIVEESKKKPQTLETWNHMF